MREIIREVSGATERIAAMNEEIVYCGYGAPPPGSLLKLSDATGDIAVQEAAKLAYEAALLPEPARTAKLAILSMAATRLDPAFYLKGSGLLLAMAAAETAARAIINRKLWRQVVPLLVRAVDSPGLRTASLIYGRYSFIMSEFPGKITQCAATAAMLVHEMIGKSDLIYADLPYPYDSLPVAAKGAITFAEIRPRAESIAIAILSYQEEEIGLQLGELTAKIADFIFQADKENIIRISRLAGQ